MNKNRSTYTPLSVILVPHPFRALHRFSNIIYDSHIWAEEAKRWSKLLIKFWISNSNIFRINAVGSMFFLFNENEWKNGEKKNHWLFSLNELHTLNLWVASYASNKTFFILREAATTLFWIEIRFVDWIDRFVFFSTHCACTHFVSIIVLCNTLLEKQKCGQKKKIFLSVRRYHWTWTTYRTIEQEETKETQKTTFAWNAL